MMIRRRTYFAASALATALAAVALVAASATQPTTSPAQPSVTWIAAGTSTQPAGQAVPMTPDLRAAIAAALWPPSVTAPPTSLPVVVSPPSPPIATIPTLPTLSHKLAIAATTPRGNGYEITADVADLHVEGFAQNFVRLKGAGTVTLRNVRSIGAYRDKAADRYVGQGLYLENCGPTFLTGVLLAGNGWQPGKPDQDRNGFRHAIYEQAAYDQVKAAGPLTVEDSIIWANSAFAANLRRDSTLRRCVLIDNGVGVGAIGGTCNLDDVVILGGHRFCETDAQGKILDWTGDVGLQIYSKTIANNVWVVGQPGQAATAAKQYDLGAVNASKVYKPHPEWQTPGGLAATNCVIAGWPGPPFSGDGFPKDKASKVIAPAGWAVYPNPVAYDPTPILNQVLANQMSIPDARAKIAADVRAAAIKANP